MASEMKEESNSTSSDVKNEENSDETKKIDDEVKDDKNNEEKESKEEEEEDEDKKEASEEEDEESDDEEVALLDRPVEVTGCRARKKVERLDVSFSAPKEKQEIPEGKGKKLGDCPRIEAQIQKMKVLDLKPMHKICFNRTGSVNEIKRNLRKFSGFPFEKDSQEFIRKKASLEKMTMSLLKEVCLILDIERSGTKDEIVARIMTFLLNPEDSGKKVPVIKKKSSKDKKKSSEKKKGKSEKKGKSGKDKESGEDAEESGIDDDDSTGGEASMGGTDEEAEALLTEPKKKSKESKKTKPKADKVKKEDKKQKGTKRKRDDDEEDDDDDKKSTGSSEDEPVAKKSKMPSDEEISKLVKKILESADLQEITMKKVIKQVSDTYPDFDLSHKKAFIKSTIKSIL